KKKRSYLNFVATIEKDQALQQLLINDTFDKTLNWLSDMIPLKRIYDFVLLYYLLRKSSITFDQAKREITKWVQSVKDDSVYHAMEYLNQNYFDSSQKKRFPNLVTLQDGILVRTKEFETLLTDNDFSTYILDVIEYGLFRYE